MSESKQEQARAQNLAEAILEAIEWIKQDDDPTEGIISLLNSALPRAEAADALAAQVEHAIAALTRIPMLWEKSLDSKERKVNEERNNALAALTFALRRYREAK